MTIATSFESLSDEIIISIFEYLTLEEFSEIFGQLNSRLSCLIYDHPWTQHQLNLQKIDDENLRKRLEFIQNKKLTSAISSIYIRPFSIYHSIETFNQFNSIENYSNLRALSVNNITLEEAELIFTQENLSKLAHLTRLQVWFSYGVEQEDYHVRLERVIAQILGHASLRHCILRTARPVDFTQVESPSSVEYLKIDCCSFQSLYTLFEFTPALQHLTATIIVYDESKIQKISFAPLLNSVQLELVIPAFDDLTLFLKRSPKLRKLNVITHSVVEPLTYTSSWSQLITEHLPALIKFKREGNVLLENIEEYMQAFHWPNGWRFEEKNSPNGKNYARITITNTRY